MANSVERISTPTFQANKFRNVLLYILGRCAGKPNVGEKVLGMLLYFSDFSYYEIYEEQMTGARYRKLSNGPIPDELEMMLTLMVEDEKLVRINTVYQGYSKTRYLPLAKPDLMTLKASEVEVMNKVIAQLSDWSEAMIIEYARRDLPWVVAADDEALHYELAFYRRPPYSVRVYEEDKMDMI